MRVLILLVFLHACTASNAGLKKSDPGSHKNSGEVKKKAITPKKIPVKANVKKTSCPSGQFFNTKYGACFSRCVGGKWDEAIAECKCPQDRPIWEKSRCNPLPCPSGQKLPNGQCLPCPSGQKLTDGQCISICKGGEWDKTKADCKCPEDRPDWNIQKGLCEKRENLLKNLGEIQDKQKHFVSGLADKSLEVDKKRILDRIDANKKAMNEIEKEKEVVSNTAPPFSILESYANTLDAYDKAVAAYKLKKEKKHLKLKLKQLKLKKKQLKLKKKLSCNKSRCIKLKHKKLKKRKKN